MREKVACTIVLSKLEYRKRSKLQLKKLLMRKIEWQIIFLRLDYSNFTIECYALHYF